MTPSSVPGRSSRAASTSRAATRLLGFPPARSPPGPTIARRSRWLVDPPAQAGNHGAGDRLMEEGPEPHEWVEKAAEEHHHGHEHGSDTRGSEMTVSAVTAAVLAVLAAFGSLLSGHAVNQAILDQTKATDQWAYYQAKSTKGHVYLVGGEIIKALSLTQTATASDSHALSLRHFQEETERYDREKEEIKKEAEHLEAESQHEFHKHHQFALGIACFQVGIVLASVSILVRVRAIYYLSVLAGLAGLVWVIMGLLA